MHGWLLKYFLFHQSSFLDFQEHFLLSAITASNDNNVIMILMFVLIIATLILIALLIKKKFQKLRRGEITGDIEVNFFDYLVAEHLVSYLCIEGFH